MAGTITSLVFQKGNQERVSVFLDGAFAFGLDGMAAAGLRKGQLLSDAEILALQNQDEAQRAHLSAVRQLGYRPRSTREVEQALQRKQFAQAAIAEALERLRRESLLDDAEFARYWTENRNQFRPRSARALRYELRQKGVAGDDIDPALDGVDDDVAAWEAVLARPQLWRGHPADEAERSVLSFLARRGFSYETARRAWKRLTTDEEGTSPPESN